MTGFASDLRLERNSRSGRSLWNGALSGVVIVLALLAAVPLFSVLHMLIQRGAQNVGVGNFTDLPPAAKEAGIGLGNAIEGTVLMVGVACAIALPFGVLAAIYLAEFGRGRFADSIRFAAKMLTGMPSILAGVFAYGLCVVGIGFSPFAGSAALVLLMLPTIVLTAEQAIRSVPDKMKHAAVGMGCTSTQVVWRVTLPTAAPGILTGVILSIARAAGETAPLLFTAGFSFFWIDWLDPIGDTSSLSVLIYTFSISPYANWQALAWTGSLVLVALVLALNLIAQWIIKRSRVSGG